MKLNNKILYLIAAGVISTLTPANTNAQTFYQCMPITCSDGQYINGNKCENCPAGTFQKGNNRATSCTACSAGTYSSAGASSCKTCEAGYACNNGTRTACSSGYYQNATGQSSCKACNSNKTIKIDEYNRAKASLSGGCSYCSAFNQDLKLDLGKEYDKDFSFSCTKYGEDPATPDKWDYLYLKINGKEHKDVTKITSSCDRTTGKIKAYLSIHNAGVDSIE